MSENDFEARKAFVAALAEAQKEMKPAAFNRENPHFRSKYADLSAVREATLPALNKHGFALMQRTRLADGAVIVVTTLAHKDGGHEISEYPVQLDAPQKMGSAITYAKRYCWAAICGVTADDDDDGNAAQAQAKPIAGLEKRHEQAQAKWSGPLTKTQLKAELRSLYSDVEACSDYDELRILVSTPEAQAVLVQCEKDMPEGYRTPAGSDFCGIKTRIEEREAELAEAASNMMADRAGA